MTAPKCIVCEKEMKGRSDKKFCSIQCKNHYHRDLRQGMRPIVKEVDKILHRNYAILTELRRERKEVKLMIPKLELEKRGFKFNYYTGSYLNAQKKTYYYVYDFQWMEFSTQQVMILKSNLEEYK